MEKPLFRDYIRQLFGSIVLNKPIASQNRHFTLMDRPMLFLMQIPIVLSVLFIYNYSPYSTMMINRALPKWIATLFALLLLTGYWLFFIYRFASFSVEQEKRTPHLQEAATIEQELGIPEDSWKCQKTWRSRTIFALFLGVLVGITAVYIVTSYSMAPLRLYRYHKQPLQRLATFAAKEEELYIYPPGKLHEEICINGVIGTMDYYNSNNLSESELQEIRDIVDQLDTGYITYINKNYTSPYLIIGMNARWGSNSNLLWSANEESAETINSLYQESCYKNVRIEQYDAHWWMIWSDFTSST